MVTFLIGSSLACKEKRPTQDTTLFVGKLQGGSEGSFLEVIPKQTDLVPFGSFPSAAVWG